jgi:tRNA modification GTPase
VEQEGVRRAEGPLAVSDLVLAVLDRSRPLDEDDLRMLDASSGRRRLIVVNKIDLPPMWSDAPDCVRGSPVLGISARTGHGLADLTRRIAAELSQADAWRDVPLVTNVRHITLLQQGREALTRSRTALADSGRTLPEEFLLADIRDAQDCLQAITGRRSSDDLLRHIFARFCIGK